MFRIPESHVIFPVITAECFSSIICFPTLNIGKINIPLHSGSTVHMPYHSPGFPAIHQSPACGTSGIMLQESFPVPRGALTPDSKLTTYIHPDSQPTSSYISAHPLQCTISGLADYTGAWDLYLSRSQMLLLLFVFFPSGVLIKGYHHCCWNLIESTGQPTASNEELEIWDLQ